MRVVAVVILILLMVRPHVEAFAMPPAQEPTPEATPIVEFSPYDHQLIGTQTVRYDYIITAGDVMVSVLLVVLIISVTAVGGLSIFKGGRRD